MVLMVEDEYQNTIIMCLHISLHDKFAIIFAY